MEDIKAIIAENIVLLRRGRGMTQIELAEKLNYSDKAVSKWERGESVPDISVLKQIADIFGVTVDYLITPGQDGLPADDDAAQRQIAKKKRVIEITLTLFRSQTYCLRIHAWHGYAYYSCR